MNKSVIKVKILFQAVETYQHVLLQIDVYISVNS